MLRRYCSPLLRVFVVWSVISLLMPFNFQVLAEHGYLAERQGYWGFLAQTPLNSLLEGGLVHLWFIPALILAATITACLAKAKRLEMLIPLAFVLYVYGVLAGSYQVVTTSGRRSSPVTDRSLVPCYLRLALLSAKTTLKPPADKR